MKRTVRIVGMLAGHIWMPNAVCTKEVSYAIEADESFREALCRVTGDGDFRTAGLMPGAYLEVVHTYPGPTKRQRIRHWELRFACWETDDMRASDEAIAAAEGCEFFSY